MVMDEVCEMKGRRRGVRIKVKGGWDQKGKGPRVGDDVWDGMKGALGANHADKGKGGEC